MAGRPRAGPSAPPSAPSASSWPMAASSPAPAPKRRAVRAGDGRLRPFRVVGRPRGRDGAERLLNADLRGDAGAEFARPSWRRWSATRGCAWPTPASRGAGRVLRGGDPRHYAEAEHRRRSCPPRRAGGVLGGLAGDLPRPGRQASSASAPAGSPRPGSTDARPRPRHPQQPDERAGGEPRLARPQTAPTSCTSISSRPSGSTRSAPPAGDHPGLGLRLLNVTLRYVAADPDSTLAYAPSTPHRCRDVVSRRGSPPATGPR